MSSISPPDGGNDDNNIKTNTNTTLPPTTTTTTITATVASPLVKTFDNVINPQDVEKSTTDNTNKPPPNIDHKSLLLQFYEIYNPEKIKDVNSLSEKYANRETIMLWPRVLQKYPHSGDFFKSRSYLLQPPRIPILTPRISDVMKIRVQALPDLVESLNSTDMSIVLKSAEEIRKILSVERHPPIDEVIATGVVPKLVSFLTEQYDDNPDLQFNASWSLTNIASGTSTHTKIVVDANAIPHFIRLLKSPNDDVREQQMWALGNICSDMATYRDAILDGGALPLMIGILMEPNIKLSLQRNSCWALSNVFRRKPVPPWQYRIAVLPTVLHSLRTTTDDDVIVDSIWNLNYMCTDINEEQANSILDTGVVLTRLVELINDNGTPRDTIRPILDTIGRLAEKKQDLQIFVDAGLLPSLAISLNLQDQVIDSDTCWILGIISSTDAIHHRREILKCDVLPRLGEIFKSETSSSDAKIQSGHVISRLMSVLTSDEIHQIVCSKKDVERFCTLLEDSDPEIIFGGLIAVECLLRLDQIDIEETNKDSKYKYPPLMIKKLFEEESEENEYGNVKANIIKLQEEVTEEVVGNEKIRRKAMEILEQYFDHFSRQMKSASKFV
jgi:importin subunit alpha-1